MRCLPRGVALGAVLALVWLAQAQAQAQDQTVRLRVGASTVVTLTENPSTGYRWSLDTAASRNLAIVTIADAGFQRPATGAPMVGVPGQRRFRITARAAGTAEAAFAYSRPWEHGAPAQRHAVAIEIAR